MHLWYNAFPKRCGKAETECGLSGWKWGFFFFFFFSSAINNSSQLRNEFQVCLWNHGTLQSVKAACHFCNEWSNNISTTFQVQPGDETLIPWGGVWSTSLLPSTVLICLSCFCFPHAPFLLKFPFSLFHVTAGLILGVAMWECPVCARRWVCGVSAEAITTLLAPKPATCCRLSTSAGWPSVFRWYNGVTRGEGNAGRWARWAGGWLRNAVLAGCRMRWAGCSLLLPRAVAGKWRPVLWHPLLCSSHFPLVLPRTALKAAPPKALHVSLWSVKRWLIFLVKSVPIEQSPLKEQQPLLSPELLLLANIFCLVLLRGDTCVITVTQGRWRGNKLL